MHICMLVHRSVYYTVWLHSSDYWTTKDNQNCTIIVLDKSSNSTTTMQILLITFQHFTQILAFRAYYFQSVLVCACFPLWKSIFQILSTLSNVVDGDGWIQLSSVMEATDHFLPPHKTTDSNEVIMSISSMSKSACVLLNEHLHGCTHNLVAAEP